MASETPASVEASDEGLIADLTPTPLPGVPRVMYDIAPAAIFKILFTVAALWMIIHIFPVLLLISLSLMLVATFNPFVARLQKRLGRRWALVGVVTLLVVFFLGTLALLIPPIIVQGYNLLAHAPEYGDKFQALLLKHGAHVNVKDIVARISSSAGNSTPQIMKILSSTLTVLLSFATVAILTIYLLIEGPEVGKSMMRLLPRKDRLGARKLVIEIGNQVGGYMRGQIITSAFAGTFTFILLFALRVPGAFSLAALAAVADAIPLIGLLIALMPALLLTLTLSSTKATIVLVAYLVYHQLENLFIAPRVYGGALGLSLTVIVVSLLIGTELMGMMGALLALPVAAAIPCILAYIREWQERHSPAETGPSIP